MSRELPSGWEDPEDVELDAEELDEETDVRLSEVAAFLATVPAPVLPGAIESRIVAALAAESAARAEDSPVHAPEPAAPRILGPAPARARVRRRPRLSSAMVAGPLLAVLLFAGLGYVISRGGSSSSSSAPSVAAPASSSAASNAAAGYSAANGSGAVGAPEKAPVFAVTNSGTRYLAATLASQVRTVLSALRSTSAQASTVPSPATVSAPAASSSSTAGSGGLVAVAGSSLRGCVLHLTGGMKPQLIDRASYQGTPVYVIATASRVWVVGLGCTAERPEQIASASLAS